MSGPVHIDGNESQADVLLGGLDDIISKVVDGPSTTQATRESVDVSNAILRWAEDAQWVYERLDKKPTKKDAGPGGRYALWKYARENQLEFMRDIMPKISAILMKAQAGSDDVAMDRENERTIKDLQVFLKEAVASI